MGWTYDAGLGTDRDKVRSLVGLTDGRDQILENETIDAVLLDYGASPRSRAGLIAGAIDIGERAIASMSREVDQSGAGFTSSRSQKIQQLRDVVTNLMSKQGRLAAPFFVGLSKAERDEFSADTNTRQPKFALGQDSFPGVDNDVKGYDDENC